MQRVAYFILHESVWGRRECGRRELNEFIQEGKERMKVDQVS